MVQKKTKIRSFIRKGFYNQAAKRTLAYIGKLYGGYILIGKLYGDVEILGNYNRVLQFEATIMKVGGD